EGIFESIHQIGAALGLEAAARDVAARERARLDAVRSRTTGLRPPTVVMIEWTDPIFAMANWTPELVEIAHGDPVLGRKNVHSAALDGDAVAAADPEFLIVAPCG